MLSTSALKECKSCKQASMYHVPIISSTLTL